MCVTREPVMQAFSPTSIVKVRMANLNSEAIFTPRSYVCGRERKLHMLSHVAWLWPG